MKLTAIKKILPKASALLLSLVLTFMLMIGAASADSAGTTPIYSKADLFTERDMIQEADLSEAEMISVTSGEDVRITSAGVYVLSGKRVVSKPIKILYHADNHVMAAAAVYYKSNGEIDTEKTPDLPQLEAYDRVIVKGKNLYDGKVINTIS